MHKFLSLALALCLAANLQAADPKPMTRSGDKALLFTFNGLSLLGASSFAGGVGFKFYIARDLAARVGVGFDLAKQTFKNPAPAPLPANTLSESKYSTTLFTIAPGITYNIATSNSVVAYVGAQVLFITTSTSQDGTLGPLPDNTPSFTAQQEVKITSTSIGAAALLGVEWFAWDNISFGAEYAFGFLSATGKTEVTNGGITTSVDDPSTTAFGTAALNTANLTLSVYF
ncbi:MAG: PorT family protein [Ignavibacteria bacterium]|nr:PorT family protein [Ignavibacteria bacterium]